ncbi:ABC transporter permease subunit [Candidatus Poriferisodalis sp.]|uniref:ABC transporter permease subunit n=1 Tax=Candidatus Poriferisodalis sp. TaxID=3101277 RepID=UPI003B025624
MDHYLLFAIVGLGFGCVYAALSLGVVITYRGTGIINFATGAMAMWGAYVYDELRRTGDLVLPIVLVRHRVGLGGAAGSVPFALAMVLAVLSCSLVGLIVHFGVFRPLRRAPILARVVASVGVLLAIQALIVMHFTNAARVVAPILPNESVSFGGTSFSRDRLWLTAVVLATTVAAGAWFRYTRLGLATRASTENEQAISLARYSPQQLAGATWVLSSTVAGFLVILTSPIVTLNPLTYVLAIVPALAAAVIGRLRSIAVTVAAAFGLGIFQSIVVYQTSSPWWPDWAITGISHALPFGVIVIALYGLGNTLPARGAVETDPLPEVTRPPMRPSVVAAFVAAAGVLMVVAQGSYRIGIITSMTMTVVMLSLVVLTGLVGQISLAQAAIAGAAGFALSKLGDALDVPFPFSLLAATLAATGFGVVVGIPALRIRGAQLAVVTLSGAVALEEFVFRNPSISGLFGSPISDPTLLGWNLGIRDGRNLARLEFGFLVLAVVAACTVAVGNLARSATGRRFLAIRSNERASASIGISVTGTKLLAFAVASFLAGLGGSLIGYSRGQLSADSFAVLIGLSYLALAYLCGITSVAGAIVAGLFAPLGIVYIAVDRIAPLGRWYQFVAGVALVLTAIFFSEGIAGAYRQNLHRLKAWRAARQAVASARGHSDAQAASSQDSRASDDTMPGSTIPGSTIRAGSGYVRKARPASFENAPVVLDVADLTVRFGALKALDGASLQIREGQIVGLIGPNGGGKTTLVDALTGFVPSRGHVTLCGMPLARESPHERARLGLTRTWQSLELFNDLTVSENVRVAAEHSSFASVLADFVAPTRSAPLPQVDAAMELVGLSADTDAKPSSLPLGSQKLVGFARALAPGPRVLLADEPAAGLTTAESVGLGVRLLDVASEGVAILLIDHDMGLVLEVCDYIYVLNFGQVIAQGTPAQIRVDDAVVHAYLGAGAHT